jgi:ribosomal protein S4
MLISPLRRTLIVGASMLAVGAAGGVAVRAATSPSTTPTASSSPSATPRAGNGTQCAPRPIAGAARRVLQIAASVTGLTQQQILDQLRQGRTLDQIAGSKAATIEQQALDKLRTRLDAMVKSGKLTADAETRLLDRAKQELEKVMSENLSSRIPANGRPPASCGLRGVLRLLVKVTAEKTGLSEQQVLQDLRNGESINQIAGSKAADIKASVLQMEQQRLSTLLDRLMAQTGLGNAARGRGAMRGMHGRGAGGAGAGAGGSGATRTASEPSI